MKKDKLSQIYQILYKHFGPQGWWPVYKKKSDFEFSEKGYHPGNYTIPQTPFERFQIIIGAILTQNTNWNNVEKALFNLFQAKINSFQKILETTHEHLAEYIRPSGYYNQKAKKLKQAAEYFSALNSIPQRNDLLALWGIGEETADSILLYAFHQNFFVIDTYTKRFLSRMKMIPSIQTGYAQVQELFHQNFDKNTAKYKEFHALFVQHAKKYCKAKPFCTECIFEEQCPKSLASHK